MADLGAMDGGALTKREVLRQAFPTFPWSDTGLSEPHDTIGTDSTNISGRYARVVVASSESSSRVRYIEGPSYDEVKTGGSSVPVSLPGPFR